MPQLVETLPRISGRPPDIDAREISVRMEAIDTLETHFSETHQELVRANAARDALLAGLGFRSSAVALGNTDDTIRVTDATGQVIDQLAYQRNQVRAGQTIAIGR